MAQAQTSVDDLIAAAVATGPVVAAAEAAKESQVQRRRELVEGLNRIRGEIDQLVEREKNDAGRRLLDGEQAAPPAPRRVGKLAKLRKEADSIEAALPLVAERIAAADSTLAQAREQRVRAVLAVTFAEKAEGLNEARRFVGQLHDALVRLMASQLTQDHLVGRSFTVEEPDPDVMFNGAQLVTAFVSKIPHRLRPAGFEVESIVADAGRLSQSNITQITGE